ncbi:MAG TPA: hypothetical protein VMZ31_04475 [Phycisphaerae bacterium]|nr:hypothetical protein [Phycisphaerae bacterium]
MSIGSPITITDSKTLLRVLQVVKWFLRQWSSLGHVDLKTREELTQEYAILHGPIARYGPLGRKASTLLRLTANMLPSARFLLSGSPENHRQQCEYCWMPVLQMAIVALERARASRGDALLPPREWLRRTRVTPILKGVRDRVGQLTRHSTGGKSPTKRPAVVLGERYDSPVVLGKEKARLSNTRYDVLMALLAAGDRGLSKDDLVKKSGHTDAVAVLKRLAAKDPDWARVILLAERTGGGYRIRRYS